MTGIDGLKGFNHGKRTGISGSLRTRKEAFMNTGIIQTGLIPGYSGSKNINLGYPVRSDNDGGAASMRRRESEERQQAKAYSGNRTVAQSQSYGQSLAASRTRAKEVALEKKKVQYNYKAISSQILRSKTSTQAGTVVSKAKREVQRLKRLMNSNNNYDEDELRAAIDHARSMERVAKKKVAHLRQEEAVERAGNSAAAAMEEIEEKRKKEGDLPDVASEETDELQGSDEVSAKMQDVFSGENEARMQEQMAAMQEQMRAETEARTEAMREQMTAEMQAYTEEMTEELMDEMSGSMSDMLEEMGLDELADSLLAPDPNMSEEDFKKLKLKHRTDEMKEMTKADADYLKVIFDKYEKNKNAGISTGSSGTGGSSTFFGGSGGASGGGFAAVTAGFASMGLPMASAPAVSVDVSV